MPALNIMDDNNYKYLNIQHIESFFNNDKSKMTQLFSMFLKGARNDYETLNEKIKESNYPEIKVFSHKLKSAFKYIGADSVGRMFELIEKNALSNVEISIIQTQYANVALLFNKYLIEMENFITANSDFNE